MSDAFVDYVEDVLHTGHRSGIQQRVGWVEGRETQHTVAAPVFPDCPPAGTNLAGGFMKRLIKVLDFVVPFVRRESGDGLGSVSCSVVGCTSQQPLRFRRDADKPPSQAVGLQILGKRDRSCSGRKSLRFDPSARQRVTLTAG